jgi:glycosyltransferase involved in cell wall biosynthesis
VARIEGNKRIDLAVRAIAELESTVRLVIAGVGSHRELIEKLAADLGVRDRVTFAGEVSDDELLYLYREALALVYVPFDEDYGLATLEAFLAEKPVITARDSGGTLEFVKDRVNGFVVEPTPTAIAAAIARLESDLAAAKAYGRAGRDLALGISWDNVISRLLSHG